VPLQYNWIPHKYRIMEIWKSRQTLSEVVIMSVEAFRTDIIVFISDVIMCFTSDWLINICMRVTNWSNILWIKVSSVIQTLSAAHHQSKIVKFAEKQIDWYIDSCLKSSDSSAIFRVRISSSISMTDTEMREEWKKTTIYDSDWKSMKRVE